MRSQLVFFFFASLLAHEARIHPSPGDVDRGCRVSHHHLFVILDPSPGGARVSEDDAEL
jgi:hypothetical protein